MKEGKWQSNKVLNWKPVTSRSPIFAETKSAEGQQESRNDDGRILKNTVECLREYTAGEFADIKKKN